MFGIHERALRQLQDEEFQSVYEDVTYRGFEGPDIEIAESKMGDDAHTLTVYIADDQGVVQRRVYTWEKKRGEEPTSQANYEGCQLAVEILAKYQVLDDLAQVR